MPDLPARSDLPVLTAGMRASLEELAAAVRASPHNLLSQRALDELEERHIAECVAFAAGLPTEDGERVLDLGTGGGFPGLVIAITRPDLHVTLLDATKKKIDFVASVAADLQLEVATLHGRAEDLQREHAGMFDVVTARAVAPLDRLIPWALPFLRPGGELHAIKGERWAEELREALPLVRRARAQVVAVPDDHGTEAQETTDNPENRQNSPDEDSPLAAAPRVVIIRTAG